MSTDPRPPVVVGVDGSGPALEAARWAARAAALRALPLSVVHAKETAVAGSHVLAEAVAAAQAVQPGLAIEMRETAGTAAAVLIDASADAHSVVLGSRGLGGFPGMAVGSVAVALAAHGYCPVVVVRGAGERPPRVEGPVVVGVDGSPASEAAIGYAFAEASVRRVPLIAVHTWLDIAFVDAWTALPASTDLPAVVEDENAVLAERLAGWPQRYPDVAVTRSVCRDRPVRALMTAAQDAQLIVVGSRGRGGFTGMGLGSTSLALVHTAQCPVAVVRSVTS